MFKCINVLKEFEMACEAYIFYLSIRFYFGRHVFFIVLSPKIRMEGEILG